MNVKKFLKKFNLKMVDFSLPYDEFKDQFAEANLLVTEADSADSNTLYIVADNEEAFSHPCLDEVVYADEYAARERVGEILDDIVDSQTRAFATGTSLTVYIYLNDEEWLEDYVSDNYGDEDE
jgi:hypothetical protein